MMRVKGSNGFAKIDYPVKFGNYVPYDIHNLSDFSFNNYKKLYYKSVKRNKTIFFQNIY